MESGSQSKRQRPTSIQRQHEQEESRRREAEAGGPLSLIDSCISVALRHFERLAPQLGDGLRDRVPEELMQRVGDAVHDLQLIDDRSLPLVASSGIFIHLDLRDYKFLSTDSLTRAAGKWNQLRSLCFYKSRINDEMVTTMSNGKLIGCLEKLSFRRCPLITDRSGHDLHKFAQLRSLNYTHTCITNNIATILSGCIGLQSLHVPLSQKFNYRHQSVNELGVNSKILLGLLPDKLPALRKLRLRLSRYDPILGLFLEQRPTVIVQPFHRIYLTHKLSGRQFDYDAEMDRTAWSNHLSSLKELRLLASSEDNARENARLLSWMKDHGSQLRKLHLDATYLGGVKTDDVLEVVGSLSKLESLWLSMQTEDDFFTSNRFPCLVDFTLFMQKLPLTLPKTLGNWCQLRSLTLGATVPQYSSPEMRKWLDDLLGNLFDLRELHLHFKDRTVKDFIHVHHTRLRVLDLCFEEKGCKVETLECPNLRVLYLDVDTKLGGGAVDGLTRSRFLRCLKARTVSRKLIHVLSLMPLKTISIARNEPTANLVSDQFFPTSLCSLRLNNCLIADAQLVALCSKATRLQSLKLRHLHSFDDVCRDIQSTSLRQLSLRDSPVSKVTLGGIPNLLELCINSSPSKTSQLVLHGCDCLASLAIFACDSQRIEISGVPGLDTLRVSCCNSLTELRVQSLGLRACVLAFADREDEEEEEEEELDTCEAALDCPNLKALKITGRVNVNISMMGGGASEIERNSQ